MNSLCPGTYDMILMDVQMPVMNGYDAARAIRRSLHKQAGTIPIIAMTANAFSEDIRHSLTAGMNAHIAKPVGYEITDNNDQRIKRSLLTTVERKSGWQILKNVIWQGRSSL